MSSEHERSVSRPGLVSARTRTFGGKLDSSVPCAWPFGHTTSTPTPSVAGSCLWSAEDWCFCCGHSALIKQKPHLHLHTDSRIQCSILEPRSSEDLVKGRSSNRCGGIRVHAGSLASKAKPHSCDTAVILIFATAPVSRADFLRYVVAGHKHRTSFYCISTEATVAEETRKAPCTRSAKPGSLFPSGSSSSNLKSLLEYSWHAVSAPAQATHERGFS